MVTSSSKTQVSSLMNVSEFARGLLRRPFHAVRHRRQRSKRMRFYRSLVESGSLVFDIGANHGSRVEVFLALNANVVAVEPQPRCVESLHRFKQRRPSQLHIFAGVAGSSVGQAEMRLSNVDELSSLSSDWISAVQASGRFANAEWSTLLTVPMTTLDALIATHGEPAFIKIDVEGYEREVLGGLSKQPSTLRALSFEFTPERRSAAESCLDYCASLGEIECNYSEGESMTWALPKWVGPEALKSFLNRYAGNHQHFGDIYLRFTR